MIKQIQEINFPSYATLSSATVTLNDMGDRTISAQVKIDGNIVPDFSYDWEVEFKGERYIQPLRQPQASKGNESIYSLIDLTFYHKTIYDLKRYFFVEMASTIAGTAIADKYIASLTVNLKDFCANFQNVLDYYFEGEITININPDWVYAEEPSFVEINYSHIWDVLLKIHEVYGVRWHIEGNTIFIGYPTEEVAHIFEYGFEGGLLKVERQVQSADICNSLLGRGGEKNLPYRYFKDASKDAQGNEWKADPDWIPELASVNFTNLRGKTFRDYIKGWKAQRYGGTPMSEPTEEYNRGYADSAKSEDGKYFNPIEYVEDKDSIGKYGLLQNGLDNVEDIFPTIQDVEVEGIGRVDEIVGAEQVIIDEATSDYTPKSVTMSIDDTFTGDQIEATNVENEYILRSDTIHQFNEGSVGYIMSNPSFKTTFTISYFDFTYGLKIESGELDTDLLSYKVLDVDNNSYLKDIVSIPSGIRFKVEYKVRIKPHSIGSSVLTSAYTFITSNWSMSSRPFAGEILENLNTDGTRKSVTIAVPSKETKSVTIQSDTFTIPEDGATNIDVPVSINTDLEGEGLYEWKRDIEAVNTETNEVVTSINIPQGTYYLRVKVEITNNSDSAYDYKVELLPSYILYPTDSEEFKPTFDIWVKNIWNTSRNAGESDQAYADRVWLPILGDRDGNEPKVVFTTGRLAGHSDWEFKIHDFAYAGGDGVEYNGVKAEWRLTLVKSESEIEATGKWIPSTMQQAFVGDHFFFIGIDMPHEYILWAEERLDDYKRDKILDTANIKPTWVVQTDKVRLNQDENGATLLDSFKVGNSILIADTRFIEGEYERLYLQSITYSWDAQTILYPNVEVVLADKPITTSNPVAKIQGDIESLNRSAVKTSDVQNLILTIGDKIYLRKDGLSQASNSPTTFNQPINSAGYRQGAFGGHGWGLRNDGGKGILEVDKLVVRDDLQVNTIVSNQIEAIGGKQIESAARITCTKVEDIDGGYKCYFDQKQGSVVNLFKVNDIALSQVFSPDNSEVKYYKRVVEAVDNNSITLSKTQVDGDGMPQEGDVIVHYGNTTDTNRQYVIIRDVIGGGYERMLSDLNSVSSLGVEYYFAGRIDGNTPRWFVGNNNQFIEYKDGHLRIKADVTIGANSDLSASEEFQDVKQTANQAMQDAQNAEASAKSYADELVKDLQNQLDGKVESFFYDYDPTLDNIPASEWTTDELKEEHLNDTFTNTESGQSWRWLFKDGAYQWVEIADTQSAEALAKAQEALGVANGKVAVFVTEPRTPYNAKDLWLQGEDGRIKRCTFTRTTTGEFHAEDWVNADDSHEYTNSEIAKYKKSVDATIESLDNAIETAEKASKDYTDEGKKALQASIDALNNAKANATDVYDKATADGLINQAEADAIEAARELANAAQALAVETAQAYADGVVDAEEEARIKQAQENLNAAKEYAEGKAKEAEYNAQQYTDLQVSTVDYLKQAFPQGAILDVNGVTLSALIGVKDENGKVVAGLYGGANDTLNDAGYTDSIHGAMLLFGGIEGVDKPTTHKTAVFEDGFLQSTYFATAKEGKRVEIFGNELKVYGDDANNSVLSISYDSTGKPRLQYTDKYGNVSWYLSNVGISTSYTVKQIDDLLLGYVKLNTPQEIEAKHTFINGLKIGDAVLSWDSENGGLKVSHADGTTAAGLYATGYITAGGIGSSSGGSGEGGSSTLAGLNDVALKSAIANDMLVYNGTHWVNTPMSAIKPDLTAYATKTWVEGNGYITASALDPYAKTSDVANTYATQTALQGVDIRVQAIEYIFEKDQDGVINKWQEIVDFLAGVEGSTLDDILDQYATKDSLSGYMPKTGGTFSGRLKVQTSDSNGFANEMNGKGSYLIHVPNVASTGGWARGLSLYDDATSTTRELIASFGDYRGNKYDYLGGTYDNHILQLRLSDKFSTFYGDVKTNGKFIGNLQGTADDASKLGGLSALSYARQNTNCALDANEIPDGVYGGKLYAAANWPYSYYAFLSVGSNIYKMQFNGYNQRLKFRAGQEQGLSDKEWKDVAFLTDNVASATKLQTPRSLWGQSFDGTANVDGPATMNGEGKDLYWRCKSPNYDLGFGIGSGNVNRGIYDFTNSSWWIYRDATANTYIPQGYVGIGTTNPQRALHIVSTLNRQMMVESSDYTEASINYQAKNGVRWVVGEGCMQVVDSFGFWNESLNTNAITILKSGFVGVGTLTPTCKLHVKGDSYVSGNAHVASSLFVDNYIYLAESESDGAIYFGDDEYAFIKETPDDVMTIASNQGLILKVNHISDEGAVIKLDGPVRIGDAILSWDATNKCVTIKNANTGEKASLLVYGGITAMAIN